MRARAIPEYWPRLLFKSGDYFFQHCWKYGDNLRAATNQDRVASDRANNVWHKDRDTVVV